jgi:hypothetical protein
MRSSSFQVEETSAWLPVNAYKTGHDTSPLLPILAAAKPLLLVITKSIGNYTGQSTTEKLL